MDSTDRSLQQGSKSNCWPSRSLCSRASRPANRGLASSCAGEIFGDFDSNPTNESWAPFRTRVGPSLDAVALPPSPFAQRTPWQGQSWIAPASVAELRNEPGAAPLRAPEGRLDMYRKSPFLFILILALCAAERSRAANGVEPHFFSREEVKRQLHKADVEQAPTGLERLSKANGVRVTLPSPEVVEFRCDGTVRKRTVPSRFTYFDSEGEPFAWREERTLRFRGIGVGSEWGNAISVDPSGRYFVPTMSDGNDVPVIVRTHDMTEVATVVGVRRNARASVFSSPHTVVMVGDDADGSGPLVVTYEVNGEGLVESDRIPVPSPRTWFAGRLLALIRE